MSTGPDRKALCPCGSGRRYKSCCLALDRRRDEAIAAAAAAQARVDAVNAVLLPIVESSGEHTVACRAGCNHCCTHPIRTTTPEATRFADWLLAPGRAEVLAAFESRLPAWREVLGEVARDLEAQLERHGGPPPPGHPDLDRYRALDARYRQLAVFCPFNDDAGRCSAYPVRPLPCRAWNVVDTSEHCAPSSSRGPSVVRHPTLDAATGEARRLLRSVEARAGRPRERLLASAVAAELDLLRTRRDVR